MKIYLLHRHRYWTEYLDFLLEDRENFGIVHSKDAPSKNYKGNPIPLFDPKSHHTILTPGLIDDPTKGNSVVFRSHHSPGFYILPQIIGYSGFCQYHPTSSFCMYLFHTHYQALLTRELDHPELDRIRYEMITDPRVRPTEVDLSLYQIKEAPKVVQRVKGTGLVCFRWLAEYVSVEKIVEVLNTLRKDLKLTMVIHPCTTSEGWVKAIKNLEGSLLEKVFVSIPRNELTGLLDENEFIITDGSGTCYEGLIRGCKPIAVRDLYSDVSAKDMAMEMVYDHLEEEYFPFCSYRDIKAYNDKDHEGFMKMMYPFLYNISQQEAKNILRNEVLSAANELNKISK